MNLKSTLLIVFAFALAVLALPARAQVEGAPLFIDYQGTAYESSGKPLGSTGTAPNYVAAPQNYTMDFKIYGSQGGTDLIWAERQTVTATLGAFAVRLGSGVQITSPTTLPRPALDTVFTGANRFLELTVTIPPASTGTAITPRLAFQTSPFSFTAARAKLADTVTSGTVTGGTFAGSITATGSTIAGGTFGTAGAPATFVGNGAQLTGLTAAQIPNLDAGKITTGTLATAQIPNLDAGKITTGTLATAQIPALDAGKITTGTLADARLSPNVARLDRSSQTFSGVNTFAGNVGIGVTPSYKLDVDGEMHLSSTFRMNNSAIISARNSVGTDESFLWPRFSDNITYLNFGSAGFNIRNNGSSTVMFMNNAGNIGIGTTTPTKAKLVISGSASSAVGTGHEYMSGTSQGHSDNGTDPNNVSLYASNDVHASVFRAFSDGRIKRIEGHSDAGRDLSTLLGIKVTDYSYIDTVAKGDRKQKKVIAQQVEKVYPQAVSRSTDIVPDIYQKAEIKDGWVKLTTNLKKGERVRLIAEKKEGIHEVLEVAEDQFRTAFAADGAHVFVYGREVKDFRSVDYEAIAMLNVSATQELARQLAAKDARIAALEKTVAALQAKDEARDTKLAAIEKALLSAEKPVVRAVSLKTGAGAE